jgi:hypothetical protein
MLEMILKLYSMYMATDVRSPMPHLVGPPGCGKSTVVEQAAELIGVNLHIINVSRLSPLDVEGIQMPVDDNTRVHMIPASYWSQIKAGDIVLYDEFLRGFPEVYNGLLDVFTSRRAGAFRIEPCFMLGASNSITSYDKALEDRLLHLPVPDPRKLKRESKRLAQIIVDQLGLLPEMVTSFEMQSLMDNEVHPMFDMLDNLKQGTASPATLKGKSIRNLIGQAQLRQVESRPLAELIAMNNNRAAGAAKWQFMFFLDGKDARAFPAFEARAKQLVGNDKLTKLQALNLRLNLQLIEMEAIRHEKGTDSDDAVDEDLDDIFTS